MLLTIYSPSRFLMPPIHRSIPGPSRDGSASHCQPEEPQCCLHEGSAPDARPVEMDLDLEEIFIHSTVYLYYVSPPKKWYIILYHGISVYLFFSPRFHNLRYVMAVHCLCLSWILNGVLRLSRMDRKCGNGAVQNRPIRQHRTV